LLPGEWRRDLAVPKMDNYHSKGTFSAKKLAKTSSCCFFCPLKKKRNNESLIRVFIKIAEWGRIHKRAR